jgi:hypothetical protein
MGEGPSFFIFSVKSVQNAAHIGPIAAERLNISSLAGSMPTRGRRVLRYSTLFFAFVFPSRK